LHTLKKERKKIIKEEAEVAVNKNKLYKLINVKNSIKLRVIYTKNKTMFTKWL